MRAWVCRLLKRRRRSELAGLLLVYVTLGYLAWDVAHVHGQSSQTYRFGSGSTFGSGSSRSNAADQSSVDALQQAVAAQGAQLDVMNERARYNIARLDELAAMNAPVRLAVLERAVKDAADNAADLKRLGYQLLAAVVAGLVLQIIHVRSQGKARSTAVDEIREVVAELLKGEK